MADEQPNNFRSTEKFYSPEHLLFIVKNLDLTLTIDRIASAKLCASTGEIVALHLASGVLKIFNLVVIDSATALSIGQSHGDQETSNIITRDIPDVVSYSWLTSSNSIISTHQSSHIELAILDVNYNIAIQDVTSDQPPATYTRQCLMRNFPYFDKYPVETVSLVYISEKRLVLSLGNSALISLDRISGRDLSLASQFGGRDEDKTQATPAGEFRVLQCQAGVAYIWHPATRVINIFELDTGSVSSSLDFTILGNFNISSVHLSDDLKNICWIYETGESTFIRVFSLHRFLSSPDLSEVSNVVFASPSSYMSSRFGDSAWRHQLCRNFAHQKTEFSNFSDWVEETSPASSQGTQSCHRKIQTQHLDRFSRECRLPESTQGCTLEEISIINATVTLSLKRRQNGVGHEECGLCFWDMKCGSVTSIKLPINHRPILSHTSGDPHIVISPTSLSYVIPYQSRNVFLNKVMLYSGAAVASRLCQLNQWDQSSLPSHTLELGLKSRQLDAVAFYLNSKEKLFTSHQTLPACDSHLTNYNSLAPSLDLIAETISAPAIDPQVQLFNSRLLNLVLYHVHSLVIDASTAQRCSTSHDERNELTDVSHFLMTYLSRLRHLIDAPASHKGQTSPHELAHTIDTGVLDDSIYKGRLALLQWSRCQSGDMQTASLGHIRDSTIDKVVFFLTKQQFTQALRLLQNLGIDAWSKLWELARYTTDPAMRDYILSNMKTRGCLTAKQTDVVNLLSRLSAAYPNHSFLSAVDAQKRASLALPAHDWQLLPLLPVQPMTPETGNILEYNDSNNGDVTSRFYSEFLLDWLIGLNETEKDLLYLEIELISILPDAATNASYVEENRGDAQLWSYLLHHNDTNFLVDYLTSEFSQQDVTPRDLTRYADSLTSAAVPYYRREILLDSCAKHGVVSRECLTHFPSLLRRLGRVGTLLTNERHPMDTVAPQDIGMFHREFLKLCVTSNLPQLAWEYNRCYGPISLKLDLDEHASDWWKVFQLYFTSANRLQALEPSDVYAVSIETSKYLRHGSSPRELLDAGYVTEALATLPFIYNSQKSVAAESYFFGNFPSQNPESTSSAVEKSLSNYPHLLAALYPNLSNRTNQTTLTLYDLLQVTFLEILSKDALFCVSKLFGWQETNAHASHDSMKEIPHFSSPSLEKKHGTIVTLDYTYFLRRGRPSFAMVSFLKQLFDISIKLSQKSVRHACRVALVVAIRNINHSTITNSCAAFVSMLGEDGVLLRVLVNIGRSILRHHPIAKASTDRSFSDKLKRDLIQSSVSHRAAQRIVSLAADVSNAAQIRKAMGYNRVLHESTLLLLCQLSDVPYSTTFLEHCARNDEWLPFLWFAQLHQYPKSQLHDITHHFKSPELREHLYYIIENAEFKSLDNVQDTESTNQNSASRTLRSSLYSRIGVEREANLAAGSSTDNDDTTGHESRDFCIPNDVWDCDPMTIPDNLFGVIFASDDVPHPSWIYLLSRSVILRNPLLSVLAMCQEGEPLSCVCGWLLATADEATYHEVINNFGQKVTKWTLADLARVIVTFIQHNWMRSLAHCFSIFQPNSPLDHFFAFCASANSSDYSAAKTHLYQFKKAMLLIQKLEASNTMPGDIFGSASWFEDVTFTIVRELLSRVTNLRKTLHLVTVLENINIDTIFERERMDYGRIRKTLSVVIKAGLSVDSSILLDPESAIYNDHCTQVINQMMEAEQWHLARQFAHHVHLSPDHVTIAQIDADLRQAEQSIMWGSATGRRCFWQQCAVKMRTHNVGHKIRSSYFHSQAERTDSGSDRVFLYQLAYDTLLPHAGTSHEPYLNDLYRQLWHAKIQLHDATTAQEGVIMADDAVLPLVRGLEKRDESQLVICGSTLLQLGLTQTLQNTECSCTLTKQEIESLNELIGGLLDTGNVSEAQRICTAFGHTNLHLSIITACVHLSLKTVTLGDMPPYIQELTVTAPATLTVQQSYTFRGRGLSEKVTFGDREAEVMIDSMEKLLSHCKYGYCCCLRVISAFKISKILHSPFEKVLKSKDLETLDSLLSCHHPARFSLAKEYLSTTTLSQTEVTHFIADMIVNSLQLNTKATRTDSNITGAGQLYRDLIALCEDAALLGDTLLDNVAAISQPDAPYTVLVVQIELLILSHACHTKAYSLEGISNVLRASHLLVDCLEAADQYPLMIRLLVGIGRYSEMSYIFDTLRQNHQFELLFRKGMDKEDELKIAILDYLKRFQAEDSDAFTMLALSFSMHREIGAMLQMLASKRLNKLTATWSTLENTTEVQDILKAVVQYYSDAAESYAKDGCNRHAIQCLRQARLAALQTQLLSAGIQIVNITETAAIKFITIHPKFTETYIVCEAYGLSREWPQALCNQFLVAGETRYLADFRCYVRLTNSMIAETLDRYEQQAIKNANTTGNVKKLLSHCDDIRMKYQKAKELRLQDLVQSLEQGDCGSFLQDSFI